MSGRKRKHSATRKANAVPAAAAAAAAAAANAADVKAEAFDFAGAMARATEQLRACVMHPNAPADAAAAAAKALQQLAADVKAFAKLKKRCPAMFAPQRIAPKPLPPAQAADAKSKRNRKSAKIKAADATATAHSGRPELPVPSPAPVLCSLRVRDASEQTDNRFAGEYTKRTGALTLFWAPVPSLSALPHGADAGVTADASSSSAAAHAQAFGFPKVRVKCTDYDAHDDDHNYTHVFADADADSDAAGCLYFNGRSGAADRNEQFRSDCHDGGGGGGGCPNGIADHTRCAKSDCACRGPRSSAKAWRAMRRVLRLHPDVHNSELLDALLDAGGLSAAHYTPCNDDAAAYEWWAAQPDGGLRVLPVPALHALVTAYAESTCCESAAGADGDGSGTGAARPAVARDRSPR